MDEKKYSQLYQALLQEVLQFHSGNQRRIRKGMLSLLLVPLVFLVLLFLSEGSRVIFLLLWIVSMFEMCIRDRAISPSGPAMYR